MSYNVMNTVRAFMYHDIRDMSDTIYPNRYNLKSFLNWNQFKHQIDVIDSKYNIISSKEIFNELGEDSAILTFDDGMKDHLYVFRYLRDTGIPATFLIPSYPILNCKVMNTHKIQFILSISDEKQLVEEILSDFDNPDEIWNEYSITKWKDNWWSNEMIFTTNFLRKYDHEYTNHLFNKYVSEDEESFAKNLYLNEDDIREISDNVNFVIGGHGNISENLLLIDDAEDDIKKSYDFISQYSDNKFFSYPNGGYNEEIKEIMSKIGFKLSFTIDQKTMTDLDDIDYLEFPRYDAPQKISLE